MSYIHSKYNGRVGLYNHGIEQYITGLGWPGASLHLDASLPTSTSVVYGYNTTSGSNLVRMSNLSDNTSNTDAVGVAKLGGSGTTSNVYIVVPATPLYGTSYGLSSSISYNTSSTYSTYFIVSSNYSSYNTWNDITSYLANSCQYIFEAPTFVLQTNAAIGDYSVTGAYDRTFTPGLKYITSIRGSKSNDDNTNVFSNGTEWNFKITTASGRNDILYTRLLSYYITDKAEPSIGKTASISELIYFDYLLSDDEFNRVETYLKNKWVISY